MNEVKTPKKPLIFYYVMVFLLLMMLNFMAIPWMAEGQGSGLWNVYDHDGR